MVDIMVPMAPAGSPLYVARSQVSAKHLVFTKAPFTQATAQIKGSFLVFESEFTFELP